MITVTLYFIVTFVIIDAKLQRTRKSRIPERCQTSGRGDVISIGERS